MNASPQLLGGRYEVGELIGRGGMAEVHLGYDTRLSRQVAIKMLRSDLARDHTFLSRFRREAQSAAGLNHASIVAVYDSGEDHAFEAGGARVDVPYIVMEYVEGKTLREVLTERGPLDPDEACRITEGILDALAYSHRMGIVHRDIKPANVMISDLGAIKVMDFGIARAMADANATMTQTQAVIGTAQYLSPEQAQGKHVDARSDLYSTGCLLFELLTSRTPFMGETPVAIAYQHVGERPPRPSSLNPAVGLDLDDVVLHSLAKAPDERYQDATAFRADVQAARLQRPISNEARGLLGAGAAAGAEATAYIPHSGAMPTTVLDTGQAANALAEAHDTTESLLPVRSRRYDDEPPRKRRGLAYTMLALAVIAVLGLLGYAANNALNSGGGGTGTQVRVPDVTGQPLPTARLNLTKVGLVADVEQAASDKPVDEVISQNPPDGTQVDEGSHVTLTVSSGPESVQVPDLKGLSVDQAKAKLTDSHLKFKETKSVDSNDVPAGKVVSTDPAAGESVDSGTEVTLNVASGDVEVPDIRGLSQAAAQTKLAGVGLKYKVFFETAPDKSLEGKVLDQEALGQTVKVGTVINFTVGQAAPTTTAPPTTTTTTSPPTATGSSPTVTIP